MRLSIAVLAAYAASAHAFKDTSPFLMFSSKPFPSSLKDISKASLQSSTDVLKAAKAFLSTCASEKYYIISQPRVAVSTLSNSLPHLQEALSHESVKSSIVVPETLGLKESHRQELVDFVKEKCGVKVSQKFVDNARRGPRDIVTKEFEPMIGGWTDSEEDMGSSDPALQSNVLKDIRKHYTYTFILLTTPSTGTAEAAKNPAYEPEFNDAVHMEMKRDLDARERNSTSGTDARPLFEKYQFLTPGLFMGLLVGILLLSILGVGLRAISSLEVSYGAFDKEMGPSAQKKQQ